MKIMVFFLLIITAYSCKTYRMVEGNSRPVKFIADSSIYNVAIRSDRNIISYTDLLHIRSNFVNTIDLNIEKKSIAIVRKPTYFSMYPGLFLVYPGEKIRVTRDTVGDVVFSSNKKKRNRELLFFNQFRELEDYPFVPLVLDSPKDSVLVFEKRLLNKIITSNDNAKHQFDSLQNVLRVSRKFKIFTANYLHRRHDIAMLQFYQTYADTLKQHGLYHDKLKQQLSLFNNISDVGKLENKLVYLNDYVDKILPLRLSRISTESEFKTAFDSISVYFNGTARDYLLSRLMFDFRKKDVAIPKDYVLKYHALCKEKHYKKLVETLRKQKLRSGTLAKRVTNNLLLPDGERTMSLADLISKYKGKVMLLDFWAQWCAPCREDIPALNKLADAYESKDIVFIKISIDRDIQFWRKFLIAYNFDTDKNYLLLDYSSTEIVKKYNIGTIPRYMIIDKSGNIAVADAPRPGDVKLKLLIDKLLNN